MQYKRTGLHNGGLQGSAGDESLYGELPPLTDCRKKGVHFLNERRYRCIEMHPLITNASFR